MSFHEKEVSIKGIITYEDFKKYNDYHHRKMYVSYFVFAFILSMVIFVDSMSGVWTLVFLISFIISAVLSGAFTLLLKYTNRIRVRREYKSDRLLKTEITYVLHSDGVHQKFRKSTAHFEWNDMLRALEDKEMFRLYVSRNKAIILPKRFFETEEDVNLFREMIKDNLNPKKVRFMS